MRRAPGEAICDHGPIGFAARRVQSCRMTVAERTIAIVDDDRAVGRALCRLVTLLSCAHACYASGEAFLAALDAGDRPCCVVLDLHMSGMSGLDVLERIGSRGLELPAIVITGFDQPGLREKCLAAGACDYLIKPVGMADFAAAIRRATGPPGTPGRD